MDVAGAPADDDERDGAHRDDDVGQRADEGERDAAADDDDEQRELDEEAVAEREGDEAEDDDDPDDALASAHRDDDLDESFFSEPTPEVGTHHDAEIDEAPAHDPRGGDRASLIEARRARSRRTVTWVVGAAGLLIGVALAARTIGPGKAPPSPTVDTRPPAGDTVADTPALPPPAVPPMGSAAIAVGAPGEPGHLAAPEASAQPSDGAGVAPSAGAEASAAAAAVAPNAAAAAEPAASSPGIGQTGPATPRDPARAKELTRQVLDLLHRTKNAEAVDVAEQAIAADPTDAMSYLYLGAALQELGREADARAAYDRCVRDATRNGFDQCRALGGRKKR
jgi:hypothetical protein